MMAESLFINSKTSTNLLFGHIDMCVYNIHMIGITQLANQQRSNDTAYDVLLCRVFYLSNPSYGVIFRCTYDYELDS
jgi:hypothetical protein